MRQQKTWFLSDLHLNHKMIIEPDPATGKSYRPFSSLDEMNETIIENINRVVHPEDKLFLLGDIVFQPASSEHLLARINGLKRLIIGNHDKITPTSYLQNYFKYTQMWQQFTEHGFVCSHVPLHKKQFRGGVTFNVHGHLHGDIVEDLTYINVCCEHTNYTPVSLEQILVEIQMRKMEMGWAKSGYREVSFDNRIQVRGVNDEDWPEDV
jgi:calcineurin-like phosphoesterase family protein